MPSNNVLRFVADGCHSLSKIVILVTVLRNRSVVGLSLKTQFLFLLVFLTRYLDLFFKFISIYLTLMKIFYISTSAAMIYLMMIKFKASLDRESDRIWISPLIIICILIAPLVSANYHIHELFWTFSIFLESVAILPQLYISYRHKETQDSITNVYLIAMGMYRFFYLLNWIYRYVVDRHLDVISITGGTIQTLVYILFVLVFIRRPYVVVDAEGDEHELDERNIIGNNNNLTQSTTGSRGDVEYVLSASPEPSPDSPSKVKVRIGSTSPPE